MKEMQRFGDRRARKTFYRKTFISILVTVYRDRAGKGGGHLKREK